MFKNRKKKEVIKNYLRTDSKVKSESFEEMYDRINKEVDKEYEEIEKKTIFNTDTQDQKFKKIFGNYEEKVFESNLNYVSNKKKLFGLFPAESIYLEEQYKLGSEFFRHMEEIYYRCYECNVQTVEEAKQWEKDNRKLLDEKLYGNENVIINYYKGYKVLNGSNKNSFNEKEEHAIKIQTLKIIEDIKKGHQERIWVRTSEAINLIQGKAPGRNRW